MTIPLLVPAAFEAVVAPWPLHLPNWRMVGLLESHTLSGTKRVQAVARTLAG